ncbi:MAG: AMP-binding protein [Actinobacteria bacterium]|nr:AMP-binding protein [Actinomycetota bacterium]
MSTGTQPPPATPSTPATPAPEPLQWASIPALTRSAAARFGGAEAVVDGTTRLSWTDLDGRVDAATRAYVAAGIEPGDRAGLWAPNGHEWIVAALGLVAAGGVLVPLSTRYKGTEVADILRRSRTRMVVVVGELLGTRYPEMLDGHDLPDLEAVVVLESGAERSTAPGTEPGTEPGTAPAVTGAAWRRVPWSRFLAAGEAVPAAEVERRVEAAAPGDISDVMFTSGTTGRPKGVVVTHGQSLRTFRTWVDVVGLVEGDRYLLVNPMSHTFGYKAGVLACLMAGATMVPLPVFDVDATVGAIERERITVLPGPPTLYQSILDHPARERAAAAGLRLAVTGAATIPSALVRRMRAELGFETVLTAYGLTECCGFATATRRSDSVDVIASTSGRAIPGVEVRVVDDGGHERPRGEAGEVLVRGFNVMLGYFEDPEATAEAVDAGGWLHTGDIGVMDAAGNLRITDRKKDMFIVGGLNAYPAEVENLLLDHPAVAQVAVVGMPDARLGEVGAAFVIPAAGHTVDTAALIAWARGHMAGYKVPRHVEVVDALPLNASGKVDKHELRRRLAVAGAGGNAGKGR